MGCNLVFIRGKHANTREKAGIRPGTIFGMMKVFTVAR